MTEEKLNIWREKTKATWNIIEYKNFWNYIDNLQQESKQLRDKLEDCEAKGMTEYGIRNMFEQRINKAIEYIKHSQSYGTMAQVMPHLKPYVNGDDLLEILGDKENE